MGLLRIMGRSLNGRTLADRRVPFRVQLELGRRPPFHRRPLLCGLISNKGELTLGGTLIEGGLWCGGRSRNDISIGALVIVYARHGACLTAKGDCLTVKCESS
jgi:hypothetical protein